MSYLKIADLGRHSHLEIDMDLLDIKAHEIRAYASPKAAGFVSEYWILTCQVVRHQFLPSKWPFCAIWQYMHLCNSFWC